MAISSHSEIHLLYVLRFWKKHKRNVKCDFKCSSNSKLTLFGPNRLSWIHLSVSTNPFIFVLPRSWIGHRLVFLLLIGDVFHPLLPSLSAAAALLPLAQRVEKVTQQQNKMREVTQLPGSAIQRRKKRCQDCSGISSEPTNTPEVFVHVERHRRQHVEHVQLRRRM